jgi:hypothetical protein
LGIAYTETVVFDSFAGTSSSLLRDGLHTILTAAGWTVDAALSNGYMYAIESPQGLTAKVRIQDTGRTIPVTDPDLGCIDFQFLSYDETHEGAVHDIGYGPGRTFQVHANQCQVFISRPSVNNDIGGSVAGGIPHVTLDALADQVGACAFDQGELRTTQAWWSQSDYYSFSSTYANFRNGYKAANYSALHNSDLMDTQTKSHSGFEALRLIPVAWTYNVDLDFGTPSPIRWYGNDEPLILDPLIGWGRSTPFVNPVYLRGQLWDAVIVSVDNPLEDVRTIDDLDWVNYSHASDTTHGAGTFFASLYLRTGIPAASDPSNYAY